MHHQSLLDSNYQVTLCACFNMNAQTFKRKIETEAERALEQLDSDEFLRAAAGGEPTTQTLLETAAASEHAAAITFETWISDESDTDVKIAFESVVEQERTHYDRVTAAMDAIIKSDGDSSNSSGGYDIDQKVHTQEPPGPMHAYLRERETTIQRIASGMVGRPLASLRTHAQLISFFESHSGTSVDNSGGDIVPEAQENPAAALFTDLFEETEKVLDDGLELLTTRCTTEVDRNAAIAVATYTIRLAADDTRDMLASMS
ncbi:MAG: hypothetical protein J07HQW2_01013 [Haloquadratum walsbyi J07HQW2]|uniref:Rubrerythrin n=2 Tax=Haloquadratum walsbyi TaxID=293091 RepID=U1PLK0_9EURY|nr:MAG: hypothetical protein J07HQW2_01013 [Haloquadratum walsbyi J07HQW2]